MSRRRASSLFLALLLTACAGRGGSRSPGPAPIAGTWQLTVTLPSGSAYRGTLELDATAGALAGTVRLVSPVTVDAAMSGAAIGDSLALAGNYTAGNGCTGRMTFGFKRAGDGWTGPAVLDDRCAGQVRATGALSR